jgi:SOS-response transcriptional repressor LexA
MTDTKRQNQHKSRRKTLKAQEIALRVRKVALGKGMRSDRKIAESAQVNHSYMSKLLKGAGRWTPQMLQRVAAGLDVDQEWLEYGEALEPSEETGIPTYAVGGGNHFQIAEGPPSEYTAVHDADQLVAFRVDGDSMDPVARHGQRVLARKDLWPRNGDLAYIELEDDGAMFKRVYIKDAGRKNEHWVLCSINTLYAPVEVSRSQIRRAGGPEGAATIPRDSQPHVGCLLTIL